MKESQLMQTFSCLTLKDRRNLRLFVNSPFHNTRVDVIRLFDYLDTHWENPKRDFTKETVFKAVDVQRNVIPLPQNTQRNNIPLYEKAVYTEGSLFDAKKLNYTMSFLDNLIRNYLVINQLEDEKTERDLLLQKAFVGRGSDKLAEKSLAQARQYFDAQTMQNAAAHFHDFRLHRAHYDRVSHRERSDDTSLQAASDAFTDFAAAEILRQGCSMLTQQAFSKRTYQLPLLDAVLAYCELKIKDADDFHVRETSKVSLTLAQKGENSELKTFKKAIYTEGSQNVQRNVIPLPPNTQRNNIPLYEKAVYTEGSSLKSEIWNLKLSTAVLAYFHAYQSLSKDDDAVAQYAHFQELRTILEQNWQQFPTEEMRGLYLLAINFCIKKINRGDRQFEREVLGIYKIGIENRLLFENNQLSSYTYKNAMMAALKVGETAWASQFLDDYKPFLASNDREMIYKYNKALYFFRNNDYNSAMQLLQTVNLKEVLFNLDARRLLARIYFELKENAALDSLIDNSKIYLHRQKSIGYHREMYLNFFKVLEILLKMDVKADASTIEKLSIQIKETQYLAEREWLLEKL
jgi:hypothetical protein